MNIIKLIPSHLNEKIHYIDIHIDGHPLASYFTENPNLAVDAIPPLGWSTAEKKYSLMQFQRLLLEAPPDMPNGRNSILVCPECGDLGCGAYSAVLLRQGNIMLWEKFGYGRPNEPEFLELDRYKHILSFKFSWEQYSSELHKYINKSMNP